MQHRVRSLPRRLADSLTLCTYSSRRRHLTLASSQVTGSRKLRHCEVTERTTGQTRAAAPTKPPHEMRVSESLGFFQDGQRTQSSLSRPYFSSYKVEIVALVLLSLSQRDGCSFSHCHCDAHYAGGCHEPKYVFDLDEKYIT